MLNCKSMILFHKGTIQYMHNNTPITIKSYLIIKPDGAKTIQKGKNIKGYMILYSTMNSSSIFGVRLCL